MTKSTITRERLEQLADNNTICKVSWDERIELARMALAAMDGEPVAVVPEDVRQALSKMDDEIIAELDAEESACRAAMDSEPVAWTDEEELRDVNVAGIGYLFGIDREANKFADPRRQIMLYRHAQPAPEYPEVLPCSVLLEPGLRFGKGIKTSSVLAALARRAVYESDMAALSQEERAEFQARIENFKALIAQPVPVVPQDVLEALQKVARIRLDLNDFDGDRRGIADCLGDAEEALIDVVNRCAAMLQENPVCTCPSGDGSLRWPCPVHAGSSPVIPDGYVMVPMRLTAENGAKGALSGEFSETKFVNCPECFGDDECETCDGSGRIEITVPVTWTTIKEIWAKGVEHFAGAPQEVKGE